MNIMTRDSTSRGLVVIGGMKYNVVRVVVRMEGRVAIRLLA